MNLTYQIAYLILSVMALLTNLSTMVYLLKTFQISNHVFALIFLDALLMFVLGSGTSIGLTILLLNGNTNTSYTNCSVFFLTSYLPSNFGALLTLLIVCIRYVLTKKAARNIKRSKTKVLLWSLLVFAIPSISTTLYFVFRIVEEKPMSLFVDACTAYPEEIHNYYSPLHVAIVQLPTFYNFFSIIIDVMLFRFLKKTIESLHVHEGKINIDIFNLST